MNFRRIIISLWAVVAVISCKKDEESTVLPSLEGYLLLEGLPEYASAGQTCTLSVKGVNHPDGGKIGYYWKVLPSAPQSCTTDVFTFTFTDTLQTCSIYCYAYAEGYSSSSVTGYVTIVKAGKDGSIKGIDFPSESISKGENTYYIKEIGSQTWTVNNMAESPAGSGFRNSEVMSGVFGRYYTYHEAIAVCESLGTEWTLPSLDEWNLLSENKASALMGNATFNNNLMWEYWPAVGEITNASGFSAIPAGFANLKSNSFKGLYEYAAFWTSTPVEDSDNDAYYKYIICDEPDVFTGQGDKESFGASVRCIRK